MAKKTREQKKARKAENQRQKEEFFKRLIVMKASGHQFKTTDVLQDEYARRLKDIERLRGKDILEKVNKEFNEFNEKDKLTVGANVFLGEK